jgi:RHS repeat-associated protein
MSISVLPVTDTMRSNPVSVSFNIANAPPGARSAIATVDGAGAGTPTWTMDANGTSAFGGVTVTLGAGTHTVGITFYSGGQSATGSTTVLFVPYPPAPQRSNPVAAVESGAQYRRSLTACGDCTDVAYAYSTPTYRSRDIDRGLTLMYSSATAAPVGRVTLNVHPNSAELPQAISVSLSDGSNLKDLVTGGNEVFYTAVPGANLVTAQFDAVASASNWYGLTAIVRNWYSDGPPMETRIPVQASIQNEMANSFSSSGFGNGWSVAGLQKLRLPQNVTGDAIIFESGTMTFFKSCGANCWTSPPGDGSVLSAVTGGFQRRYRDGTTIFYDYYYGEMQSITDRLGQVTRFEYLNTRLTRVIDPTGQATTIAWSAPKGVAGTVTITLPDGRASVLTIDAYGRLTTITDPDGVTALVAGYTGSLLTSATNRLGATTNYEYDQFASAARVLAPTINAEQVGSTRLTTTIRSRALALLPAAGTGTTLASRAAPVTPTNAFTRITGPAGDSTQILSDGAGMPTMVITVSAIGKADTTSVSYSDEMPSSVSSSSGTKMWFGYDHGLLTSSTDGVSQVTTVHQRNGFGQDTTILVNQQVVQTNRYSTDGRSLLTWSASGIDTTRYAYDGIGRVLSMTDGGGHVTSLTYASDPSQNIATATKDGKTTQFAYDASGRLRTTTNPIGQVASADYDALNRVTSATAPAAGTSTWSFNDPARTAVFTDAIGQSWGSVTNALGLPTERWGGASTTQRDYLAYDSRGNLSTATSRAGAAAHFAHDALGRVTQISASNAPTTTITYDPKNKWVAYSNSESVDTVFVDGSGRVARQTSAHGSTYVITSTFLADGSRWSSNVTSPAWSGTRRLYFGDDLLGRPDFLTDAGGGDGTMIAYNADNQVSQITIPTSSSSGSYMRQNMYYGTNDRLQSRGSNVLADIVSRVWSYDQLDRTATESWGTSPNTSRRSSDYDAAGRLAHWKDEHWSLGSPVEVCDPPPPGQLIGGDCHYEYSTTQTTDREQTYGYDAVGNRTDLGASTAAGDRLMSYNGYSMTYDLDGNMLTKSHVRNSLNMTWNGLGQLTSVTNNGVTTSYGYDGLGRRVRKTVNGTTTRYLYDGDNLAMELDSSGQPQREYSYYPGVDHPHAVRQSSSGNVYYYITNATGSVVALVNKSNQAVNQYQYTPFGEAITVSEQVPQPLRFAAREFDTESGLYYNRARYYDPSLGRFISEDPIGLAGGSNPYVYSGNNAIDKRDPSGLASVEGEWGTSWSYPFSWESLLAALGYGRAVAGSSGALGGSGGGNGGPDVPKHLQRVMSCNRSAGEVMNAVENNFGQFASYEAPFGVGLAFSPPSNSGRGSSIPIAVFAMYQGQYVAYNTSVNVQSMDSGKLTFTTVPGHLLYPATISFSAKSAGNSQVRFAVDISGKFANLAARVGFRAGGTLYEDAVWNNLMRNVGTFCGANR